MTGSYESIPFKVSITSILDTHMRATQTVEIECIDENVCAVFNELSLDIEAELVAKAIHDWTGCEQFTQEFTAFEDEDVDDIISINGVDWRKVDLKEKVGEHHYNTIVTLLVEAANVEAWIVDEPDDYEDYRDD